MDADPLMRRLLALPGVVVDWLDGRPLLPDDSGPERVYPLVHRTARHPVAHLALEPGLHYHLDGDHVLAYQIRGRTAFAIGGLNASPGERAALLRGFSEAVAAQGIRRKLIFPLQTAELDEARQAGFRPVQVGVEAWLDLDDLTWRGKRFATVRNMVSRARRRGVRVDEVRPEACREDMRDLFQRWLASKRPSWRMKLLVGSPGLSRPFDRRYLVARSADRLEAFVTLVPGGPGRWGVDVLCRRPDAIPGTMDLLIAEAATRLRDEGAQELSLGACPMAGVEHAPALQRAIFDGLYRSSVGNRVFGFRNLHRFKDKFRPRWEPVWFAAEGRLSLLSLYLGCRMWGLY